MGVVSHAALACFSLPPRLPSPPPAPAPTTQATLDSSGGALPLPLIKNAKTVNPREGSSAAVFQLETAMGSAIECFDGAAAVVVPRTRFAPVKTTSDLFLLRSDVYTITPAATIEAVIPNVRRVAVRGGSSGAPAQSAAAPPGLVHACADRRCNTSTNITPVRP